MTQAVSKALHGMEFEVDDDQSHSVDDADDEAAAAAPAETAAAAAEAPAADQGARGDHGGGGTPRKDVVKGKRGGKANPKMIQCPVCGKEHVKKPNTKYCDEHKKTVEAMFRQLKKDADRTEGKKEKKVKLDIHKKVVALSRDMNQREAFAKLVNSYDASCPSMGYCLPRDRFDFVQYLRMEKIFVEATRNFDCEPKTKPQFMTWAQDKLGGDMEENEAEEKWDYYRSKPHMYETDQLGKSGSLRIWVPTREFKRVRYGREESNVMEASMKPLKNPEEDDISDLRKGIGSAGFTSLSEKQWTDFGAKTSVTSTFVDSLGHTSSGSENMAFKKTTGVDFEKVLVDAGACYASRPAKKAKCEGDEGGDAACGGDNVSDNTSQPDSDKRKKKVVDFNIWSTIEKARFERECASLASSLIEFNQEVQKAIDCHNAQLLTNLEEADHADPEKLTKQELLTLAKYFKALSQHHALYNAWLQDAATFEKERSKFQPEEYPIAGFSKMVSFSQFENNGKVLVTSAKQQSDVDRYTLWCTSQKKSAREFRAQVSKKLREYRSGAQAYVTAHKSAAKKRELVAAAAPARAASMAKKGCAASNEKAKKVAKKGTADVASIFDTNLEVPCCYAFASEKDFCAAERFDYDKPFAVHGVHDIVRLRAEDDALRVNVDFFETSIAQAVHAKGFVRAAACPTCPAMLEKMGVFFKKGLSETVPVTIVETDFKFDAKDGGPEVPAEAMAGIGKKLKKLGSFSICGIGGSARYIGLDYDDVGSLRVTLKGVRHVVLVNLQSFEKALQKKGIKANGGKASIANTVMMQECSDFAEDVFSYSVADWERMAKSFSATDWKDFAHSSPDSIFKFTARPRDMLFAPPGWLMAEIPMDKKVCLSFRMPVVTTDTTVLTGIGLLQTGDARYVFNALVNHVALMPAPGTPTGDTPAEHPAEPAEPLAEPPVEAEPADDAADETAAELSAEPAAEEPEAAAPPA